MTAPANKLNDANVMAIIRRVRFSSSEYSGRVDKVTETVALPKVGIELSLLCAIVSK